MWYKMQLCIMYRQVLFLLYAAHVLLVTITSGTALGSDIFF